MDAKTNDFSCFFKKGENARNYLFYNIKRGSGHLKIDGKSIQNPSKINAKRKHAKSMENDATIELKWGPKWIRNSTLAVWGQILRRLNFDEFLKLEKSSKNQKKTKIWSSKGRGRVFWGAALRNVRGGLRLWSSAKTLGSCLTRSAPRNGGGGFTREARTPPGHVV